MVEFNKDDTMKLKFYPLNCIVKGENQPLIIIITPCKWTFFANNSIQKAWI